MLAASKGHRQQRRSRESLRRSSAFSLFEVLIVVAIIGVLASAAVPNYMSYVYKSRRKEAIDTLEAIYRHQTLYQANNGEYADTFDELGFEVSRGTPVDERTIAAPFYTYTLMALDMNGVPRASFRAVAASDVDPADAVLDVLVIENQRTVVGGP